MAKTYNLFGKTNHKKVDYIKKKKAQQTYLVKEHSDEDDPLASKEPYLAPQYTS